MNSTSRWIALIVVSSWAAVLAAFAATGNAWSMIPVLWFLAVIPGLPYVLMLRNSRDAVAMWITAIGLSIAIDAVVAEVLLYTRTYTAATAVVVLAVIACSGAVLGRLRLPGEASEPAEAADLSR